MSADWLAYGYSALVACGGILGYIKAGSIASLVAGLFFGALAGFGTYQMSHNPKNVWVFLGASGTLAGVMGFRFLSSWKIMPAGLAAGASILMVVKVGLAMFRKPHRP